MNFNDNLKKLRLKLLELDVDAIFVSMNNFFGNFKNGFSAIRYISGFSGSNGRAVVSKNEAILTVDGRYTKQASEQVDSSFWTLKTYPKFDTKAIISEIIKQNETLAIGSFSITYSSYLSVLKLANSIGFKLKIINDYPIPNPPKSDSKIYLMNEKYMGEFRRNRIQKIQNTLGDSEALLLSDSAALGWVFGVRTSPNEDKCVLPNCVAFIKKDAPPIVFSDLEIGETSLDFDFHNISDFENLLRDSEKLTVNCDFSRTALYFPLILQKNGFSVKETKTRYGSFEAIKNNTEIQNMKLAAERVSLSFIKALAFAENVTNSTEVELAEFFENDLKGYEDFVDLSFNSISAFERSTAIVHYNPKVYGNRKVEKDGLFLLDAGAHFKNATTDMTRTIYRGDNPLEEIKTIYSAVLRSIVIFSSLRFPNNSKACYLDSIARFFIWNKGHEYNFGTGHGVGIFGNVHEHPRISPTSNEEITNNMIVTIEPGIYKDDYGIRMENMLLTKLSRISGFVEFETLSYIPFCKKLIIKSMFSNFELEWLNRYHKMVYDKFSGELVNDKLTLNWLKENTMEI